MDYSKENFTLSVGGQCISLDTQFEPSIIKLDPEELIDFVITINGNDYPIKMVRKEYQRLLDNHT